MGFIEQIDEYTFKLHVNVKANSKRQEIINSEEFIIIHVRAKPTNDKANKELIKLLKNKLKIASNQIDIISGRKSKNKVIQITLQEEDGKHLLINKLFNKTSI